MAKVNPKTTQTIARTLIWGAGAVTALILVAIVIYILARGLPFINWEFLTTVPRGGLSGEGGISSTIVTTLYLIGLTIAILVIPGVGTAIYLTQYARDNWPTNAIRYAINTLAGVPSIVFGLFGFALFVTVLSFNFSILSGALTLVCLLLPTLISTSEEAIRAVPPYQKEAGLALGATKWQTILHVILPAALPGIVTGIILCIGRAIGETACLYVTMGGSAAMPTSLLSGGRTMALHVFYLATDTSAFDKAMATAAILVIVVIIINSLTNWIARRFQLRLMGRS
ncbi:MAG TPA: phosphate ABC transporter permease PstA [Dehalococcoidales bacterium]|nr:phosphate ABC transporter permease PstA [Dehalococcoidales bacterium]